MPKLIAIDLAIGYANKKISNAINIELTPNSLVCLLGQNGVGKSTLMRTLANLQTPLQGQIRLGSTAITSFDKKDLARQLGIITTEKIGTPNMKVRELVALGRYPYTNWLGIETTTDTHKIEEAIARCRIHDIVDMPLGTLSDGQFQKVMIARVLAQDTDIILMDEPTAHLDIVNRLTMFRLLHDIKNDTGKSILISTHELDLSLQFADQLWLMDFNTPIVTNIPEELGWSGAIDRIFYSKDLPYHPPLDRIISNHATLSFWLIGNKLAIHWVALALKRTGMEVATEGTVIHLAIANDSIVWEINGKHGKSIHHLLEVCKQSK